MFVIWGSKRIEKSLGYVAEYCPICRKINEFQVFKVNTVSHIYYISLGEGNLLGYIGKCEQCGTKRQVDAIKYRNLEKQAHTNIETLVINTNPNVRNENAVRIEIDNQINEKAIIQPKDREVLIREPFLLLEHNVVERYKNVNIDKESTIGCVAAIILPIIYLCVATIFIKYIEDYFCGGALLIATIGVVYTFIQLALARKRYVTREIIPQLARTLKPLNPSQNEIQKCLEFLKQRGLRIGKEIKFEKLWVEINK